MKVWIAELYVLLLYYYFPIHSPLDFAENEKKKKKKDEYMAFNDHLSDFSNPTSCLPGFFFVDWEIAPSSLAQNACFCGIFLVLLYLLFLLLSVVHCLFYL